MSETTSPTSNSGPSGYNTAEVADLAALGAKYEDTLDSLRVYIERLNIFEEWNAALDAIKAETGFNYTYYDSPYYTKTPFDWEMSLTAHGIEFETYDRDRERLGFFIPFTFLSPETREQCIADLRIKYAAIAARQNEGRRQQMQTQREQAERALAKAQADLAALDTEQD